MDREQILNDQITMLKVMLDGRQSAIWTALPGIVQSVDYDAVTCEVQLAIKAPITDENGVQTFVDLPVLPDVPIVFPRAGGFIITMPLDVGDEVLVVFASRCIDAWWQNSGIQKPMEARMHDLSDGFAIPGPCSQMRLPDSAFSDERIEIRNDAGDVFFSMGTKFGMVNQDTDLKTLLSDLTDAVNGFMETVSALGLLPPGTPVTNTMIAPAATSAVAALAAVTTEIGALLEDS